ncbi:LOW QUALITY PROTEIN: hypothetical protein Cgig2_010230 [Carnegiea gigantea]|uniref:Uncharacterized protein n=1 Tax=Carnegiea gigantea TaxID=171969 RepID=A0A9Q1Q8H8_9CARY|nr:LOW QUALITY PROTEIN: hypothetical protein Cgig2_010230 [Carnegiea gigantea]
MVNNQWSEPRSEIGPLKILLMVLGSNLIRTKGIDYGLHFEDIFMDNVSSAIIIDHSYSPSNLCKRSYEYLEIEKHANPLGPSTMMIPASNCILGPIEFSVIMTLTIKAKFTLRAPSSLNAFNSQDGWIVVKNIDRLTGGRTFDGQGRLAPKKNNFAETGTCNLLAVFIFRCKSLEAFISDYYLNNIQLSRLLLSKIKYTITRYHKQTTS